MTKKLKYKFTQLLLVKKQTATANSNSELDAKRKALKPGIRLSKFGNVYTETRENHSDVNPKKQL